MCPENKNDQETLCFCVDAPHMKITKTEFRFVENEDFFIPRDDPANGNVDTSLSSKRL